MSRHLAHTRHKAQRGLALMFALLALLALSLGAVALVRSVDTGSLVLGNLGFKQEATANADRATQAAIDWLGANASALAADSATSGYYASAYDNLDSTGQASTKSGRVMVDWNGDSCRYVSGSFTASTQCTLQARTVASGSTEPVTLRYAIFRLCNQAGAPNSGSTTCVQPATGNAGGAADKGALDYSKPAPLTGSGVGTLYRIVVQAVGARNTSSFTETIVQF